MAIKIAKVHLILLSSLLKKNLKKGHLQVDGGRTLVHLATLHVEEQAVVLASILAGKVDQSQLRDKIVYSGNIYLNDINSLAMSLLVRLPKPLADGSQKSDGDPVYVFADFDHYDLGQCQIEWTAKLNSMTHDR